MADAQQLQQQLQVLMPLLQPAQLDESSLIYKAHVSLLWATSCIQQFGKPNFGGQGSVLAPVIDGVPQVSCSCFHAMKWVEFDGQSFIAMLWHMRSDLLSG